MLDKSPDAFVSPPPCCITEFLGRCPCQLRLDWSRAMLLLLLFHHRADRFADRSCGFAPLLVDCHPPPRAPPTPQILPIFPAYLLPPNFCLPGDRFRCLLCRRPDCCLYHTSRRRCGQRRPGPCAAVRCYPVVFTFRRRYDDIDQHPLECGGRERRRDELSVSCCTGRPSGRW